MAKSAKIKAALVTGGADRLGKAFVLHLAEQGYAIALHYRSSKLQAQRTARQIRKKDGDCHLFQADLLDKQQAEHLIKDVKKQFPGLTLLINNASLFNKDKGKGVDQERLKQHLGIHLTAPYVLTLEFARLCTKGQIINMLDTRIFSEGEDNTGYRSYTLSKKALADWTRISALKLAPSIRVNGIAPGLVLPPAGQKTEYLRKLAGEIPLKRAGGIKHVIKALDYLVNSDFVTGEILSVDGGQHLC